MKYIKRFNEAIEKWKISWLKEDSNRPIGYIIQPHEVIEYVTSFHFMEDYDDSDLIERIEEYNEFILSEIPLSELDLNEFQLDDDKVKDYEKDYLEIKDYPPIVVGELSKNTYTIIDGLHRANSLYNLGFEKIKAYVGKK